MAACLSGRYRPSYAPVICNHGPQPRGISETLAFCIVKPCQNPTLRYNHRRFPHAVYIFIILPFCLYNTNPLYFHDDFLFSKYLQLFVDSINFDTQTDSSLNGFETVDKLVVYKGVMCFNPIPVFTPFGYIYKVTPLAKVAHSTKLFIYIWEANFKSLFLFVILK